MALEPAAIRAVLLDIEGTTTPVDFVYRTLFPYARGRVAGFLAQRWSEPEVMADRALLRAEHAADGSGTNEPPPWSDEPAAVAAYVLWLMDQDRKSTGLKSLQGHVWEEGYRTGAIRGEVYEDVPGAFRSWRERGRRIAIYSSGSALAQKLLFAHTACGDLTPLIDAHFDTTTGPKREATSYAAIARAMELPARTILFASDVIAELDAARAAAMETVLIVRAGAPPASAHPAIQGLDDLHLG